MLCVCLSIHMYVYEVDRHADATSVTNVGVDAPSFSTEKSTQLCPCGSACADVRARHTWTQMR
jgi:hypothetical protein